ncbi:MAG TPA: serine hydrolase [Nocardia sp.]|uniref:serine hydrolase domain-containing protein n=1 Tax=Nocardia TaxID=1817 RepID=UPI0024553FAC|nr:MULTISPECIES: serine hydrolase [Nocardia]HLS76423.1 serine hydrolase [Nocardia sp.]
MRSVKSITALAITAVAVALAGTFVGTAAPARADGLKHCAPPQGRQFETATPEEVGLDSAALAAAMAVVDNPTRLNVKLFRNNCLVATGAANERSADLPWNLWSATKSVLSLLAGIAIDQGRLGLDTPIGAYLPEGLGSQEHRQILVRNMLTESSGMDVAVVSEGITGITGLDSNVVAQALGTPVVHEQGTTYGYSQRGVDLLAYVISRAVGEDLQAFAQRELFDPLGIDPATYHWARDRSGNTYGHAHLLLAPDDFAKVGLLVAARGRWGERQIVSSEYLAAAAQPSPAMSCWGFLFVVNGEQCESEFAGLPKDAIKMSGMLRQDNYIVPSLGLVLSWTGVTVPGSAVSYPHDSLRALGAAFRDPALPDPGEYVPAPDVSLSDPRMTDPTATFAALGLGPYAYPGCDPVVCLGKPLPPPFADWPSGCVILGCFTARPNE